MPRCGQWTSRLREQQQPSIKNETGSSLLVDKTEDEPTLKDFVPTTPSATSVDVYGDNSDDAAAPAGPMLQS